MGYRCANDLFSYCSSEPKWGKPPETLGAGNFSAGGSCKLNPKTCGKHQTLHEQVSDRLSKLKLTEGVHKPKKAKRGK